MRDIVILLGAFFCLQSVSAPGKKEITLDDLYKNYTFRIKDVPGFNAMNDGKRYTQKDEEGAHQFIRIYDLETGKQDKTIFDNKIIKFRDSTLKIDGYTFSKNEQKLLLLTDGENIYRRSVRSHVYVYDITTGSVTLLDDDKVLHATFSPDGEKIAFVKNNNLYYRDLKNGITTAVTADGEKNKIINGNCDWVYEEEFEFTRAFEWNADGSYLAWYRFDESLVPEYTLARYSGLYPQQYVYKYPKAGERNSLVEIHTCNLQTKQVANVDLGSETDQYIPRIKWGTDPGRLFVFRMNRHQNKLEMLQAEAASGKTKSVYAEKNKYYISINDEITFLPGGHSMVFRSERDGYNHLYFYDWKKNEINNLTPGSYDVDHLVGVDIERKLVYYTAAENSPLQRNLYVVSTGGLHKKCLTPEPGMHIITPCDGYNYFIDRYSRINKVPVYNLISETGRVIRVLEDNAALEKKMGEYAMGKIKLMKLEGAKESLNAWMITPPGFDKNKKYPVLMYQYSGPGSQEVADKFPLGNYFWHQMLAEKGYIVVCVDGTGTGFRGEAFRKKTYLQLGKYESDDQIAVARSLGALSYVDKDRIGIWGWSYGGFMSCTCILKGNDVFKTAIAVAPVTNWRYYDNIYTERYMRTPKENPSGYDDNSPEKMAGKLKGKFLYIHGTADDNVHFQNSVMFTTALINANKDYDSEYYPDKNHGISGGNTRYHLYRRMTNFILSNL